MSGRRRSPASASAKNAEALSKKRELEHQKRSSCTNCGQTIEPGSRFCTERGAEVE